MKRDIYIRRIKEFILLKPGRPFEEVETFAEEIGAHYDELEAAILTISDELHEVWMKKELETTYDDLIAEKEPDLPVQKVEKSAQYSKKRRLKKRIVFTSILITVFLLFGTIQAVKRSHTVSQSQAKKGPTSQFQTVTNALGFKQVYANQLSVDPKKVFSVPSSKVSLTYSGTPKREVFGFFPYWMLEAQDKVIVNSLTSVSIFGLEVDKNGNIFTTGSDGYDPGWAAWNDSRLDEFVKRLKRKRIKTFLTLKSFSNQNIENLVLSNEAQKKFIANTIALINSKSFDGVNIDFEYVGSAQKNVIAGFTRLIANLSTELKREIPGVTLTVDTYLRSASALEFFDVELLEPYVDSFVVMAYDVHTPSGAPGPIAPMEGENGIAGFLQSYLERVDPSKIILAVPYYGYDWSSGREGADILTYAEAAAQSKNFKIEWDASSQTPYYRYESGGQTHEVHFENSRSLGIKYDFVNNKKLKGVGIWAIGYDGLNQELNALILEKFGN